MDPFLQQLAELCRTEVTRSKWVIAPSHAVGRTLGERIAVSGTNWLNLRFVTPLDIAARMGAPFLVERGIDPSDEGLGPALIMRLLLGLPEADGYFRHLADQPSMAEALWTAIRELRMAGVRAADLDASAFESPDKHRELQALLLEYEDYLANFCRADMAALYKEALLHPDWCPIEPGDLWTTMPDVVWTPLQEQLLKILPGQRILPRALTLPAVTVPRRFAEQTVERVADTDAAPLAKLLAPTEQPVATIDVFHAGGREAEVEEVCRRVLALGVPLDQVEIACASDAHVALLWEKAMRHDWAIALGPGIAAAQTRPGRALIGFCDWIEADFPAGGLRRLLQSGDLGIELEDEGFTASQASRALGRAEAGWGRDTYRLAFGRLIREDEARSVDPDVSEDDREYARSRAELSGKVRDWINGLIEAVPAGDANGVLPLARVVEAGIAFVDRTTARKSALDHRAASSLIEHIAELRSLGAFECRLDQALRFLRERVAGLHVAPERPRPGHLYVCSLSQACYSGRPHLSVVGLEEGRVFPAATEDAVLLDREREAIAPGLRRSGDRIDEAVYGVLSRLATWTGEATAQKTGGKGSVTFSYSCRDTREFRETYASWLVLQAFRLQQGKPSATYQDMKQALGEPRSLLPLQREQAVSAAGWWMHSVVGAGDAGVELVAARFASLEHGRHAMAGRGAEQFTHYDGHVPDAGTVLDPCARETGLSVTELQEAATCPFRFFLKRGLGLRAVQERERDRDVWLDPLTRGSELHDLYAAMLRRCRDENRGVDLSRDRAWLRERAEARLRELAQEMPPATQEILDRETHDFLADLDLFLEAETKREPGVTPVAFEVSFGRPLEEDEDPLATPEQVPIDLGGGLTFKVAGRIDRIDEVGPSSFEIIDYKTGQFWREGWQGVFDGGRRLQHALYGLAAVELLKTRAKKPKVTGGVYYFSSVRGRGEKVRIGAPSKAATAKVLADLRQVVLDGGFAHARSERECTFCDYRAACDGALEKRGPAKLQDAKLVAFGRLGGHE